MKIKKKENSSFNESIILHYNEIPELISGLKKILFNYHYEASENTLFKTP